MVKDIIEKHNEFHQKYQNLFDFLV